MIRNIWLYKCDSCERQRFEDEISAGKICRCGSVKLRYAEPTVMRKIEYFMHYPKEILTFVKENILRIGR